MRRDVGGGLGLGLGDEAQIAGRLLQGIEQLPGVVPIQQTSGQRGGHVNERRLHRVQVLQRRQQQLERLAMGEGACDAHLLAAQAQMAIAIRSPAQRRNLAVNAVLHNVAAELDASRRLFAIRRSPFAVYGAQFAIRFSRFARVAWRGTLFAIRGSRFAICGKLFAIRDSPFAGIVGFSRWRVLSFSLVGERFGGRLVRLRAAGIRAGGGSLRVLCGGVNF